MTEPNKPKETAEAVKALVEAVPVYQDLAQPTAKEIGMVAGDVVRVALAPIKALVWGFDKIGAWLTPELAARLKSVPPERVITPKPTVAGPALEALRFAGTEPDLRAMYANLLAKAMDSETAATAHPAFVDILRQITPDEAKLLQILAKPGKLFPLISVARQIENPKGITGSITAKRHISTLGIEAGCAQPRLTTQYIENLCRLGVCEIPPLTGFTDKNLYKELEDRPEVVDLRKQIDSNEGQKSLILYELLQMTDFGRLFCEACVMSA